MLPETSDYNKNNFLMEMFLHKPGVLLRGPVHMLRALNVQLRTNNIITVTAH